jgi:uncharacterized integral membrane protein
MELIATLLIAFPLGYFIRQRLAAYLAFVAVHSFLFTFQSTELIREWVGGSAHAFPKDPDTVPWAYGLVNLAIYGLGFALVTLGGVVAMRRQTHTRGAVDLAS